jgi:hypothetical protein
VPTGTDDGGLKRFKDLLEAMSVTEQGETKV